MGEARYDRLRRYGGFTATLPRWQELHAAVIGLGGLGGGLVDHLARIGVARLTLIDRDIVCEENLGHQQLFTLAHAETALPKAVAAAEYVAAINPEVETAIHAAELNRHNIAELLHSATLLFDGLDNYYARFLLNDYALRTDTPYFYAGVVRGELSAKAVIPGVTGCLRCLLPSPPAPGEVPTCAAEGVFPPLLGVANALQLDLANKYLAGAFSAVDDALYALNVAGWQLRKLPGGGPRADCPACQGRFEFLDGTLDAQARHACHGERVEAELPAVGELAGLAAQLERAGFSVRHNRYCAVAERAGLRYTVFSGGRIVLEGAAEPALLNRFIAEYLGV